MDTNAPSSASDHQSPYEAPTVVDYGSLAEITAGSLSGDFLDSTFPVNTPKKDLTFS